MRPTYLFLIGSFFSMGAFCEDSVELQETSLTIKRDAFTLKSTETDSYKWVKDNIPQFALPVIPPDELPPSVDHRGLNPYNIRDYGGLCSAYSALQDVFKFLLWRGMPADRGKQLEQSSSQERKTPAGEALPRNSLSSGSISDNIKSLKTSFYEGDANGSFESFQSKSYGSYHFLRFVKSLIPEHYIHGDHESDHSHLSDSITMAMNTLIYLQNLDKFSVCEVSCSGWAFKSALFQKKPTILCVPVYESFESEDVKSTGIIDSVGGDKIGDYAMVLYGYNDETRRYTVKNLFGSAYGDNGFFHISYDLLHNADIVNEVWVIDMPTEYISPYGYYNPLHWFGF